jgi:sugar lactone lactonase YvrE
MILASVLLGCALSLGAQIPELSWSLETVSEGHGFTEGAALAPDGTIFFSDMDNRQILRFDPETGETEVWNSRSGRSNGLLISGNTLYACEASGRCVVSYDLDSGPGSRSVVAATFRGDSLGSPNDLAIAGDKLYFSEFWIEGFHQGSGATRQIFTNRIYSVSLSGGEVDSLEFKFDTPNGIAVSPDGNKIFTADVSSNKLYTGHRFGDRIGMLHLLADLGKMGLEGPDGMAVAEDGRIFLALYGSECLLVLQPDGSPAGILQTGPLTSNCVFAPDGKTLYITADRKLKRVVVPPPDGSWKDKAMRKLDLMGHRNWILVVDKAFPEQSSPGMTYLYVAQDLPAVLKEVLGMLESSTHVTPVIYRDRELEFLTEEMVPGIGVFKSETDRLLAGYATHSLLHEEVFEMLEESSSLFTTLVIKTSGILPYTSVFMQLDCAYWGPEEENELRDRMKQQ